MQGKEFRSYLEKELDDGAYADLETMDARMLWGGGSLHIEDVPEAVTTASERARDIIGEILDIAEKEIHPDVEIPEDLEKSARSLVNKIVSTVDDFVDEGCRYEADLESVGEEYSDEFSQLSGESSALTEDMSSRKLDVDPGWYELLGSLEKNFGK